MSWADFLSGIGMFLVGWVIVLVVLFITIAVVVVVYRELKKHR